MIRTPPSSPTEARTLRAGALLVFELESCACGPSLAITGRMISFQPLTDIQESESFGFAQYPMKSNQFAGSFAAPGAMIVNGGWLATSRPTPWMNPWLSGGHC